MMKEDLTAELRNSANRKNVIKTKHYPPPTTVTNAYLTSPQKGSMLLETIIVLGMITTFTPLLYKHVAERRAEIENINRANTLLYLQQKHV